MEELPVELEDPDDTESAILIIMGFTVFVTVILAKVIL